MTRYCLETVAADPRPGMMVIFTFEFAILTVFSTFTLCRYLLSLVSTLVTKQQMVKAIEERKTEIRAERAAAIRDQPEGESLPQPEEPIEVDENEVDVPGWEEKRRWLFALEMTADFLKLLLYIVFFTVSITFSGLPMHIMRDVYMTFASFTKRLGDYVNYKKATSDMNARYPDATTAEIRDDACIVCREDMIAWEDPAAAELDPAGARPRRDEGLRAKKLPCGHILHLRCLKAWLERQQVCPTCRRPVIAAIPPLATNAAPVNCRRRPGVPPAPVANNAAQPRQANPNRARFFNLGPLRVGFLNAPAGQMDNIVNQLRGVQPPAQQAAHVPAVPAATAPGQPTGSDVQRGNEARLSQTELARLSQRLAHEANMLNVEQSQLSTIRAMAHEFGRLSSLHEHNTALGRTFQPSMPNLDASPQMLTGHPSQSVPAGNEALPQGMTLPEGAPSANVAPPMLAELSSSLLSPPTGTDSSSQIPTPPSSTPVQTSRAPQATSTEVSSVGAAESEAARTTPWTSQNWDFNSSPERSEPEHNEKSSPENPHDKGKGRAVEVEDVPDTEE
ncbi:hypothetical protein AMS68_006286 [Peltaster fructicola]|uniref:RING-type E3 ubiquitin transferase n=1 Tax=Peltaster fructicola TaxID=286661 RepID=A0A6H0Y1M9_9PEZI|nr:hypothetical protein AMS68_006286 [Peltaster fructicola]